MPPEDPLKFVTDARVTVVAGKGGVGKTTVTAVLARAAARAGQRVLVVELDGKPVLERLLPGLEVVHVDAATALGEYLDDHGLAPITARLRSSGVIDVVASASPGIDDLVVLGKIKQFERSGRYDHVIVDGPAAGHAISLLTSPAGLRSAARGGPIATQASDVLDLLADGDRCQVVLVTLPEATPVNEVVETAYSLEDRVGVRLGPLVVNAVDDGELLDTDAAPPGSAMRAAAVFRNARRSMHATECRRLADELALPQVHLPLVAGARLDHHSVERLVDAAHAGVVR
ncbi:MAG: ArsA family ATPase [Ilumatobacteraceae bacterium]